MLHYSLNIVNVVNLMSNQAFMLCRIDIYLLVFIYNKIIISTKYSATFLIMTSIPNVARLENILSVIKSRNQTEK